MRKAPRSSPQFHRRASTLSASGPNSPTTPMEAKASPQESTVRPPPDRSSTTPTASGPRAAPTKPTREWTARVVPRRPVLGRPHRACGQRRRIGLDEGVVEQHQRHHPGVGQGGGKANGTGHRRRGQHENRDDAGPIAARRHLGAGDARRHRHQGAEAGHRRRRRPAGASPEPQAEGQEDDQPRAQTEELPGVHPVAQHVAHGAAVGEHRAEVEKPGRGFGRRWRLHGGQQGGEPGGGEGGGGPGRYGGAPAEARLEPTDEQEGERRA